MTEPNACGIPLSTRKEVVSLTSLKTVTTAVLMGNTIGTWTCPGTSLIFTQIYRVLGIGRCFYGAPKVSPPCQITFVARRKLAARGGTDNESTGRTPEGVNPGYKGGVSRASRQS